MTSEQTQAIDIVYRRFIDSENERPLWNPIDEAMEKLQWIDADQLVRESKIASEELRQGKVKCNLCLSGHKNSVCFAPRIMEAVRVILTLCDQNGLIPNSHSYILQYYLALKHVKVLFSEAERRQNT